MSTTTLDLSPALGTIQGLARSWIARHPELSARISRAVALVSNVQPGDRNPNLYFVEGSGGRRYVVRVNRAEKTSSCTCPDHAGRGIRCKHIISAALWERGLEIENGASRV